MPSLVASRVYDLYGRFYDSFEPLFKRRLARAIFALPLRPGDRVLDIGIGTGLSLEYYPSYVQVTGIDLSSGMLQQAQRKLDEGVVRADCPRSHTQLLQANAMDLPFAQSSFDTVLLSHVVATVPDPHRCIAQAMRVVRDHGYIVMVNHFRSPNPVLNWMATAIDPICRKLGWRSDLSLTDVLAGMPVENIQDASQAQGVLFRIVYLQKRGGSLRLVAMSQPAAHAPPLRPAWSAKG